MLWPTKFSIIQQNNQQSKHNNITSGKNISWAKKERNFQCAYSQPNVISLGEVNTSNISTQSKDSTTATTTSSISMMHQVMGQLNKSTHLWMINIQESKIGWRSYTTCKELDRSETCIFGRRSFVGRMTLSSMLMRMMLCSELKPLRSSVLCTRMRTFGMFIPTIWYITRRRN